MKHSYLLAGTTFKHLVRLLIRNGFSPYPKYLLRLLFLMQNGIWASIFSWMEKRKFGKMIAGQSNPDNPVFIIGHWRTGSTFLHQLMSQDKNLVSPTVFQVSVPEGSLVSEKYYKPMMSSVMGSKRPMDNVRIGFSEPQEDEYALLKLTHHSPLEDLIFPKSKAYFLREKRQFEPVGKEREIWKKQYFTYCKKLTHFNGKRLLFKNPFHSMRIKLLLEMFPNARFIHIHRHPFEVVPSAVHMWNIVGSQNCLRGKWVCPTQDEVTSFLGRMLTKIHDDLSQLPDHSHAEISFEQLESDPVQGLKYIYNKIGLTYTDEFERRVTQFLSTLKDYKKNRYDQSEKENTPIFQALKTHFQRHGYEELPLREHKDEV